MICGERAITVCTTLAKIRPERAVRGSRYRSGARAVTFGYQVAAVAREKLRVVPRGAATPAPHDRSPHSGGAQEDLGEFRTQEFGRPESEVPRTADARPTNE